MKSHVQVAVIGGGVVGCSVLYHLTKAGWRDVVLLERDELTSGSTWHAAGGMHTINGDPNVAKLQAYTINLYKEIEQISGQSCGVHITAGIMLACTRERFEFLKMMRSRGRYLGLDMELISVDEAARRFPLMDKKHFIGALYNTLEGHVDPSGVTHAYAKAARVQGAEVYRFTRVTDLKQRPDGTWDVITDKGNLHAEHVVNAGGLWARECGRMVGLELPLLAMEHQYIVSDDIPEVVASPTEMLHVIDFDGEIYMRQEGKGMLMGTYEREGIPWSERETPWTFGHELLPNDLDRIAPSLEVGFEHFPAIGRAGIKRIVNGPFTFAPDGNPLVGPVRGLKNYWVACAVMAGFSQGGGVGLALSNWMVHGDPGADIWGMDVSRYGDWATMAYTNAKVRENYSRRFRVRFPNEELPAARPLRTTPIYDRLQAQNAVFGAAYGLEHALWFAPSKEQANEEVTFKRSNAHDIVAQECRAVREGVGLMEISTYAKYEVTGPDAETWLSRVLANRMPRQGRIALTPMLNHQGKLIGDFTVAKLAADRFFLVGSGIAENYHMRWWERHMPERGVALRAFGAELVGLSVAGPKSRDVLQKVVKDDLSTAAFPFLSFRNMEIGLVPALVGRISFTGDLGYEIWVKPEYQRTLYDALLEAGREFGIRHFGARALQSLRLEKSFGTWAREYRPIYGPYEAGLDRFIDLRKNDFVGREAAAKEKQAGPARRLVTFAVDATDADTIGDEPVWHEGKVVGWITSGGYAHYSKMSIAMGYIPAAINGSGKFEVEILGERRPARLCDKSVFDPEGTRMRA
ncbi:MAG TPA: FAD-dependent oxidoreductase [Alphaproteobacteria bacterium]|nr:FAD-dependent oxidoreductase [Alphaproteobacteria bacterium]